MADKPKFDPSKPFEVVDEKPKFDPSKPFEAVDDSSGGAPAAPADSSVLDDLGKFATTAKDAIVEPAKKVAGVLTGPMELYDQVAAAPVRAGVGAMQRGGGAGEIGKAVVDQFLAGVPGVGTGGMTGKVLESTPTGEEIAFQGMKDNGVAAPFAAVMAPAAGVVADAALDVGNIIPVDAIAAGAGKLAKGAAKVEKAAATAIARTGQVMTQGVLKADKALQMYKELSAAEMLLPGTKEWGPTSRAIERVGAMRQALRETPITVPGSHDVAQQVKAAVEEAMYRSGRTPGSERVLQMIADRAFEKQVVATPPQVVTQPGPMGNPVQVTIPGSTKLVDVPRDLTLDELDDLVREADDLGFTPIGNPRSQPAKWGPTVMSTRRMLDDAMQTIPPGSMFKDEKQHLAGLLTAGTKRSKLVEIGSNVATLGAGALTLNPAALLIQAARPGTYVNMLAALHVPRDIAQTLRASYETGRLGMMRDALAQVATRAPELAEKIVRATVLLSGKPSGQQLLTPEEAGSLDKIRVFDPNEIMAEKGRIEADDSLTSVEKADQLSKINRDGYITYPGSRPAPQAQASQSTTEKVFGGQEGLDRLMKTLENH